MISSHLEAKGKNTKATCHTTIFIAPPFEILLTEENLSKHFDYPSISKTSTATFIFGDRQVQMTLVLVVTTLK